MENNKERLFSDFAPVSRQEWLDKITVDLKGADFNKKLVWRTSEGFSVQPFYQLEDVKDFPTMSALPGKYPFVRGNKKNDNNWFVRQNVKCEDAKETNAKILALLDRGVDSLGLQICKDNANEAYLKELLAGVTLEAVELNFKTCPCTALELAKAVVAFFDNAGACKVGVHGSIEFDPIAGMLLKGKDLTECAGKLKEMVEIVKDYKNLTCVTVSSLVLQNAGAFCFQESGYALAWGNEYMQLMTEAGVCPREAARRIRFSMGVGSNYFMEIAKFRAFRMLWAKIVKEYGVPEEECYTYIMATTTEYNKTLFDSHVNLLRTQTEAMSSALAGVEAIVVTAFNTPYEEPTEFSERIARNQQLMLKEENHFGKIVDVAAGSYYIEELTRSLGAEAWKLFLSVEKEEGFLAVVKAGKVQAAINATNDDRHVKAAQRREFILGPNKFPNFTEKSEGKKPCCCKCCCAAKEEAELPTLKMARLSSDFEALRLQTEGAEKRPVAFMLTIGDLKWRQARAQFSCNFLAAAGYEVKDNLGFNTVEEGVEAAVQAGADIVVLCSSDAEYATYGVPAYQALNGRALFIVAGNPACTEDLKAAGIEYFIHVRVNQLETLKDINAKLGIK